MERIEGLQIDLGLETTALSRGLTGLKDKLRTVNSEMKANLSAFDRADQSVEKYEATLTGLNRKLNLQQAIVDQTRKEYERLSEEFGENSKEAEKAAREYNHQVAALNNLQRSVDRTGDRLEELQREQAQASSAWGRFRRSVDDTGDSLTNIGEKMRGVGGAMTAGLSAPIAAIGIVAGKTALEFDSAQGRIQAQLGITKERAEELGNVAENVWTQGFGESVTEVANTVSDLANRMDELSPDQLEEMTASAFILAKTFDADVNLVTRSAASLMDQFGVSGSDAMDMITAAFQRGGNYSDELLETINEYSPQFKNLGFSAEEMMGIFVSGAESGIWSLDKLADATKESFLQIIDGADGTHESLAELGLDWKQITGDLQAGGEKANAAFGVIMTALAGVEDGADRNRLAIELMGTPIEDLGPQFVDFFSKSDTEMKNFRGSTKKAGEALQDNLGARSQKLWRDFLAEMEPVGETLVDLAEDVLPKVADVIEDLTGAFDDLSPGAQKTVLAVGGIALAAGPTLTAIGFMTTGIGGLMKVVAPLLPMMGAAGGTGFLGILRAIPGPVGAVAAGLGLAAGGFSLYKNAVEESKTVNLDHASSLADQSAKLSDLTGKYNALREKNQLSNDELLRFRDINSELNLATSADEITRLKDEQAKLQEKSGLTNDELSAMFGLNDDLVAQAPSVDQTFSDRGNAIINNRDGLKQANDEMREQLRLELENQRIKADANLDQAIRDQIAALQELGTVDAELDAARAERDAQRLTVTQAQKALEDAIASGNQAAITIAENELFLQEGKLQGLNTEVSTRADIVGKKQEAVEKSQEEISKTQQLYNKLIDLQLAQAGINAKGDEGIAQLDQAISKNQTRIGELKRARDEQGGLNQAQKTELGILEQTVGTQQTSRQEIGRIKGEQDGVNQKVSEGKRRAEEMTRELKKDTKKNVKVDDNGGVNNLNERASKGVTKKVTISALISGLTKKAKDILGFEKGTRHAPGGLSLVGEKGPEVVYLPRGARVIPNDDTEKILKSWNIPLMANGGTMGAGGRALTGERGPELVLFPGGANETITKGLGDLKSTFKKLSSEEQTAAQKYFEAIREDGDWLNDWLSHLPDAIKKSFVEAGFELSKSLGNKQSANALVNFNQIAGTPGPEADIARLIQEGGTDAEKYFEAIREDGDWLNDWLTHLPDSMRKALVESGFNLALSLGHQQSANARMNYNRIMGSFQTGGIASRPGIYRLAEDGFSEFVIPTNPARRSEASKLLALAAKTIDQQPGTRAAAATATVTSDLPQPRQPVMIQLITPDRREFARWMIDDISELQKLQTARINLFERR
jgi:phage-related minor tail protein